MNNKLTTDDVTPEELYRHRRLFLKTSIYALSGLTTAAIYRRFRDQPVEPNSTEPSQLTTPQPKITLENETTTSYESITNYNNFYEFSTDKEKVAHKVRDWKINDWSLEVSGLVENPLSLNLKDLESIKTEERIYRFRCVEGWSMVIPWLGFPLWVLLEKAKPLSSSKFVAFESYFSEIDMPDSRFAGIPLPYVEGLRLDEAFHPLTFISTGLYGKNLPKQNGAPLRLVVPWKYGFKSIKSLVRIHLTDKEPKTTWNIVSPNEYGFYSNVNPKVAHPRWSQATERRIGEIKRRPTLMFNGYEDEIKKLYLGMDLEKNF